MFDKKIAIIGCGNIGMAMAKGFKLANRFPDENLTVTVKSERSLARLTDAGFRALTDNKKAIAEASVLVIAVTPQQIDGLLASIKDSLEPRHTILSVVSGISCERIREQLDTTLPIVRVMPNTAAAIGESMTCLAHDGAPKEAIALTEELFGLLGKTVILSEEMMVPATVLCACGTAFFLRAIRAASQGGIEIGFHPDQAIPMAAQVAKGAAALLSAMDNHPETEIDKVTTPKGSTITGLNTMEHQGFSSAMIQGILASYAKTMQLYS